MEPGQQHLQATVIHSGVGTVTINLVDTLRDFITTRTWPASLSLPRYPFTTEGLVVYMILSDTSSLVLTMSSPQQRSVLHSRIKDAFASCSLDKL